MSLRFSFRAAHISGALGRRG